MPVTVPVTETETETTPGPRERSVIHGAAARNRRPASCQQRHPQGGFTGPRQMAALLPPMCLHPALLLQLDTFTSPCSYFSAPLARLRYTRYRSVPGRGCLSAVTRLSTPAGPEPSLEPSRMRTSNYVRTELTMDEHEPEFSHRRVTDV